jgi:3-dehydroquinate dehydratase-2
VPSPRLLVLHGPNLNQLGTREPALYGTTTLAQIDAELRVRARAAGCDIDTFQSNSEGDLITRVQQARGAFDAIVINPGGLTHTSVALRDALAGSGLPVVEAHLTNLYRRSQSEPFRAVGITSSVCAGVIEGFGPDSYYLALDAALRILAKEKAP